MQREKSTEWISDELRRELRNWQYPLHFIDFETSRMALPYHKGMRPYEQIAFQWSCHTVHADGRIVHKQWINTDDAFPSFKFAQALRDAIGDTGTPLMWSHHERSTLRDIAYQQDQFGHIDAELGAWIERLAGNRETRDPGRLVDMNAMAMDGYFHPSTKGKTSIKFTLSAVLQECRSGSVQEWLRKFDVDAKIDLFELADDKIVNPYRKLPAVKLIEGYHVNEGTAAMRAYQDMMYGLAKNDPELKHALRDALLKYCKLDTLAMVIIWEHWRAAVGEVKEKMQ